MSAVSGFGMLVGTLFALLGATCLYLCARQQRLRRKPLSARVGLSSAAVLALLSVLAFRLELGALASVYSMLVSLILGCSALPFLGLRMSRR